MAAATLPAAQGAFGDEACSENGVLDDGIAVGGLADGAERLKCIAEAIAIALDPDVAGHRRPDNADRLSADRKVGEMGGLAPRELDLRRRPPRQPANISGGAGAEHNRFEQRVGGEPVGAMQPGGRDLARRPEPREARSGPFVRPDAAHVVMRGWGDRESLARRVQSGSAATLIDGRKISRKPLP